MVERIIVVFADCVDLMTLVGRVQFQHYPTEVNGAVHELDMTYFLKNFLVIGSMKSLALS
jgi:hypothetical protein